MPEPTTRAEAVPAFKPEDLPEGWQLRVTVEDGEFVVDVFESRHSCIVVGEATGADLDSAARAAVAGAE